MMDKLLNTDTQYVTEFTGEDSDDGDREPQESRDRETIARQTKSKMHKRNCYRFPINMQG